MNFQCKESCSVGSAQQVDILVENLGKVYEGLPFK